MPAYLQLAVLWASGSFDALVVSNSWGIFHPSLEDFPPGHPYRFIDNPNHIFHYLVRALAAAGVDIIFCGNNCGNGTNCAGACASGTCLSKTDRMIMGANAYQEVLTIGGCDTNDQVVGYSSRGPSIPHMFQHSRIWSRTRTFWDPKPWQHMCLIPESRRPARWRPVAWLPSGPVRSQPRSRQRPSSRN